MKPLTNEQILNVLSVTLWSAFLGLITVLLGTLTWAYVQPPPLTYEGAHALNKVAFELQTTIWHVQDRTAQDQALYMNGYTAGVADSKRGRNGFSSDAEGLCYTMLTQEQARRFLDELRKLREERP